MTLSASPAAAETQERIAGLREAFASLAHPAVARYTELVSSSLADPLRRDVNEVARTNAWAVQVTHSGVTDTQVFETPDAAARAYRVLARTILNDMSLVVGARLANSLVRDIVQKLEPALRQLIQTYHLVPDAALGGQDR